ncbi:MAG: LamG-like jellyroll fold domain-containing protein, partial [Gammaproteobacteria bacterium]
MAGEPIEPASIRAITSDIALNTTSATWLDASTLRIQFPSPPGASGWFAIEIDPTIAAVDGSLMDTDHDGIAGEPVDDAFRVAFGEDPYLAHLKSLSPVLLHSFDGDLIDPILIGEEGNGEQSTLVGTDLEPGEPFSPYSGGSSLRFNGTGHVALRRDILSASGPRTVTFWAKITENVTNGEGYLPYHHGYWNSGTNFALEFVRRSTGNGTWDNAGPGESMHIMHWDWTESKFFRYPSRSVIGEWTHFTLVYEEPVAPSANGDAVLYLNGSEVGRIVDKPLNINVGGGTHEIGGESVGRLDGYARPLIGNVDNFALFDRALSADEIVGLYQSIPKTSPSAYELAENHLSPYSAIGFESPDVVIDRMSGGAVTVTGNAPSARPGPMGTNDAIQMDGNSYVDLPAGAAAYISSATDYLTPVNQGYSLVFWARNDQISAAGYKPILATCAAPESGAGRFNLGVSHDLDRIRLWVQQPDGSRAEKWTDSGVVDQNAWNHYVLNVDGANQKLRLFVNGRARDEITFHARGDLSTAMDRCRFGHGWEPGSATDAGLQGSISAVSVYQRPLTNAQVNALYESAQQGDSQELGYKRQLQHLGPIADFDLAHPNGDTLYDVVGQYLAQLDPAATYFTVGEPGALEGENSALYADAAAAWTAIKLPQSLTNAQANSATGFTTSFWFKPGDLPTPSSPIDLHGLLYCWIPGAGVEGELLYEHGVTPRLYLEGIPSTSAYTFNQPIAGAKPDAWNHLVMRIDRGGNTVQIFLNGVEQHSTALASWGADVDLRCDLATSGAFFYPFEGWLDQAAFFDRPLSAAEILDLYQSAAIAQHITTETVIADSETRYDDQDVVVEGTGLTIHGDHRFTSLTIKSGAEVTLTGQLTVEALTIEDGGTLTHPPGNAEGLTLRAGVIDIRPGGSINVDGRGHIRTDSYNQGVPHGGQAGNGDYAPYGDMRAPVEVVAGNGFTHGGG